MYTLDDYRRELDVEAELTSRAESLARVVAARIVKATEPHIRDLLDAVTKLEALEEVLDGVRFKITLGVAALFLDGRRLRRFLEVERDPDAVRSLITSSRKRFVDRASKSKGSLWSLFKRQPKLSDVEEVRAELARLKALLPQDALAAREPYARFAGRSTCGRDSLSRFLPTQLRQFEQAAQLEDSESLTDHGDFKSALTLQMPSCERILSKIFWDDVDELVGPVFSEAPADEANVKLRAIVELIIRDRKPTLGVTERWVALYRHALRRRQTQVLDWTRARFAPAVMRYAGEELIVEDHLTRSSLSQFLGKFVSEFRNPLVHGKEVRVDREAYQTWCDEAYGARSLHQWFSVGPHPDIHATTSVGWIGFLLAAARDKPEQ